jgi:hypothetical protein
MTVRAPPVAILLFGAVMCSFSAERAGLAEASP